MLLVLLDHSAAFDTIDHKILVSRLSKRIGVSGTALDWFQSYLEGWTSRVEIAGNLSEPITANFGLPQGCVVGPIGYRIYTLPVGELRVIMVSTIIYTQMTLNFMSPLTHLIRSNWKMNCKTV